MKSGFYTRFFFWQILVFIASAATLTAQNQKPPFIEFVRYDAERKVDVMVDGKHFTSYCWPDNVYKPILYPVLTSSGTEITRGFPLRPREGERNDHIHQVGIWLNYGNVNGLDFWGNGHRGVKEPGGGEVKHLTIEKLSAGAGEGILTATAAWLDPDGRTLLSERTEYRFIARGSLRMIDRITTLTAGDKDVDMKDTKEGMFGIRVARQLELPSKDALILLDREGKPSQNKVVNNEGITGNYRSSEGVTGEAVWSTRAKWMLLYGSIGEDKISLAVCDHPKNPCYPTYWHARGYGLFAANPLGWSDFTGGKEVLNFSIPSGKSVTFRYRVVVGSGEHLSDAEINNLSEEFSLKY